MASRVEKVVTSILESSAEFFRRIEALTSEDVETALHNPETYTQALIVFIATVAIYWGSKRSAMRKEESHISSSEAAMFPLVGSAVLVSLYLLYQFVPRDLLNTVLSFYFLAIAVVSLAATLRPENGGMVVNVAAGLTSVALGVAWWFTRNWIVNDIIAFGICISGLQAVKLPNVKVAWMLLWGLFLYDIWWVFGTTVMVSVARNIEAPVLVKLPKNLLADEYVPSQMMMLGLGDIVIPGFYIALCYRFDLHRAGDRKPSLVTFYSALFCYVLGLTNTMLVMVLFQHAQPALLYLVPWCTIGVLIPVALSGNLSNYFAYDEEVTTDKDEPSLSFKDTVYNFGAAVFGFEPVKASQPMKPKEE